MFLIGLSILLLASFLGSRLQGMSLSMLGGLGVWLFMFVLNAPPADPPFQIMLCIAAVVAAVGTIEAAGGLSYLVQLAELCIRKHPRSIIYISPMVTYAITFLGGTNHIAYSILPVIAEVSKEVGIRPERPLSLSVIAALHGALASPISAIMVILSGLLRVSGIEMVTIFKVIIPSTVGGLLLATFVTSLLSKTMPATSTVTEKTTTAAAPTLLPFGARVAKHSIVCFLLGSLAIVLIDALQCLRPSWEINGIKVLLPSDYIMPLVMLSTAASIMLLCRISPKSITRGKAFTAGIQGMFSILGIAWLSSTFVQSNQPVLLEFISTYLSKPWQFSIILICMAAIMGSSAATIKSVFPLGIALGIPPKVLLASAAAVNGVFIIPIYPTMLAAIHLDTTGTTRIGKFLFNHSFMLPGLVSIAGAVGIGFFLICIGGL
ncbi:MAG: anaerobic C4-dicarboxylate transporter family protein [Candidatus Cardinium sp.]|uniref:anaerobic C4-dicarboxylate transporter family protein n=1 Tax=Cardinium endosymbiont of Dermatophagoides farinae TaxID=2597823 RepID=UPI001182DCD7|nr:anaerobic C4-dicarboxylate transporter family protein [Cardinium endosymbiont of Dermatophagoides farinae]TSJ80945.1 C4-dicarboxylate ABC transporter [Cardinium endosymbiont of Dermatophagoides farinae]UWW96971.1 MAG: anaerobic C4-dicarboxylate transporter family protein [Candidatus Cardinium sp.]